MVLTSSRLEPLLGRVWRTGADGCDSTAHLTARWSGPRSIISVTRLRLPAVASYLGIAPPDVVAWPNGGGLCEKKQGTYRQGSSTVILQRKASHTCRGGLVYAFTQTQTRVPMCSPMSEGIED